MPDQPFKTTFAIIGIDPGKTTGVAIYRGGCITRMEHVSVDAVRSLVHNICVLSQLSNRSFTFIFACERYNIGTDTLKKTRQPDALKITGVVRDIAHEFRGTFIEQNASDAKKMGSDATLKRIGWYKPGMRHANDAAAQVLLALAKLQPSEFERIIAI